MIIIIILTTIIIMSNPYVGYGYQVIYILLRAFITGLIIPLCDQIFNKINAKATKYTLLKFVIFIKLFI